MITVKGFRYYDDSHMPGFEKKFENLGQFLYHIQHDALDKEYVKFPAQNDDGTFNQQFAGTFSGQLRYADEARFNAGDVSTHIDLITDEDTGKILFSSGRLTGKKGHISTPMKEMLENLEEWTKDEYEFAD